MAYAYQTYTLDLWLYCNVLVSSPNTSNARSSHVLSPYVKSFVEAYLKTCLQTLSSLADYITNNVQTKYNMQGTIICFIPSVIQIIERLAIHMYFFDVSPYLNAFVFPSNQLLI